MLAPSLDEHGYSIATNVVAAELRERLLAVFTVATDGRAGNRGGFEHAAVRELACSAKVRALVEPVLGAAAFAHRATLFDKTPAANWLVGWHQDLVVPVGERRDIEGFGPWSEKDGVWHVQPPAGCLSHLLAVRIDLDGSDLINGALRVLPGSHQFGVLGPERIAALADSLPAVVCEVPLGGALLMRPLLLHSSRRAMAASHRRVVHLEFAASCLPGGIPFADQVGGSVTTAG